MKANNKRWATASERFTFNICWKGWLCSISLRRLCWKEIKWCYKRNRRILLIPVYCQLCFKELWNILPINRIRTFVSPSTERIPRAQSIASLMREMSAVMSNRSLGEPYSYTWKTAAFEETKKLNRTKYYTLEYFFLSYYQYQMMCTFWIYKKAFTHCFSHNRIWRWG